MPPSVCLAKHLSHVLAPALAPFQVGFGGSACPAGAGWPGKLPLVRPLSLPPGVSRSPRSPWAVCIPRQGLSGVKSWGRSREGGGTAMVEKPWRVEKTPKEHHQGWEA